jgi:hypothetical protein
VIYAVYVVDTNGAPWSRHRTLKAARREARRRNTRTFIRRVSSANQGVEK